MRKIISFFIVFAIIGTTLYMKQGHLPEVQQSAAVAEGNLPTLLDLSTPT